MERPSLFGAPRHKVLAYLHYLAKKDRALTVEMLRVLYAVEKRRLYRAERFPQPDVLTTLTPVRVETPEIVCADNFAAQAPSPQAVAIRPNVKSPVAPSAQVLVYEPEPQRARVEPIAPERYVLQVTIPAATQEKLARDGWQCSFPMPDGGVCGCRWKLQFHHVRSRARGGLSVASNLKIRCANHHRAETEAEFGAAFVEGQIEQARMPTPRPPAS